ncbi:MAG TPA: PaaI family thioesterase [Candidatus Limnocylindria bacterium]|nr:PaaI family thioesterase [Candidatus Limnocylindria bacterium]
MAPDAEPVGSSREIVAADGRRYAFADHHCFACGGTNPIGMGLHIELDEGRARTTWRAGDDFVGWSDKLHGGIVATLLDEVMAWACASSDAWAVTAEMTVRYRSPAAPGEELVAEGRVVEQRRRIYQVVGEVRGGDGRLVAEGSGRYLGASPTQKADLKERYGAAPGVAGE